MNLEGQFVIPHLEEGPGWETVVGVPVALLTPG